LKAGNEKRLGNDETVDRGADGRANNFGNRSKDIASGGSSMAGTSAR